MIQITDHNTGKTANYATKGAEFIDSIFTPGATVPPLHKVKNRKNERLYFITPEQGIARRHLDGFICQFKKQDDGKIYFFHTLDKITITE